MKGRRARVEHPLLNGCRSAEVGIMGSCRGITLRGDRATEKVSICACLLCAFPALRFAKCSLTVRPVQFRSPLAKIITTSKRKCARSCGAGDAVQGGGMCPKQYLLVLQGCISAHCANIQPHNLAFSVARSPRRVISRQDPLYLSSYFGAHKNKKYYLKAFLANLFQCLYDILMFILQKRFF